MQWSIQIQNLAALKCSYLTIMKDSVSIGRSDENDLVLKNKSVSRYHSKITYSAKKCYIEDCKSMNGTYVYLDDKWNTIDYFVSEIFPVSVRIGKEVILRVNFTSFIENDDNTAFILCSDDEHYDTNTININGFNKHQSIMVLDLCESTSLAAQDDVMAFHLKKKLMSLAQYALQSSNPIFVKSTGDGFIATFTKAVDALQISKSIMKSIESRNNETFNPQINVRLGLHQGKVYMISADDIDVHGHDVNIAFRIESLQPHDFINKKTELPATNRIFSSCSFYEALSKEQHELNINASYCGKAMLKGIADPFDIYLIS
jgi:class 3 adenylate cyclase